ncbi:DNA topoisomerase IB [Nocardiopsis sp. Huas11]|uniref:DNA topoisomerase IB n=1 Tax=Nocardiopsis sp. Huas11 TaxID=2183912 RepID=UPI000EACB44A|nr:DNA topoisomerase IB [Nocardiopsis sp. Huas11]RKS05070.1 DNA topoisomerase IB [Nocardiopsis sp. Huas11]
MRRSDPDSAGITRVRRGRGFRYYGPDGAPVTDPEELERIRELVVPPAWRRVWICPEREGHIQARGTDDEGRLQYVYHPQWRRRRDREKFEDALAFAERLPRIRVAVAGHLDRPGLGRERVLATALRLVDLGLLRAGGEAYAACNESYGAASLLREHVRRTHGTVVVEFPGKSGRYWRFTCADPGVHRAVAGLQRVRSAGQGLFAYRDGERWRDVRSEDLNAYLSEVAGADHTVKEFRTWHATVLAAVGVAVAGPVEDPRARARLWTHVAGEVAAYLGNSEAVARESYIDPRVFRLHERGVTVASSLPALGCEAAPGEPATRGRVERAVGRMLREHRDA